LNPVQDGAARGGAAPGFGGVLQASTLYLVGNIASRAVGFLAIPFYSHYLSAQQYGALELIELSTQAIGITFGLQSIGMVLARLFHDQSTAEGEREIASTSALSAGLLNTVIVGLCMMLASPLSEQLFHNTRGTDLLQLAFIGMWFSNLAEVTLTYERIRERAKFFFYYSMINLILTLAFNIYFIGYAGDGVYGFVYSKLIVTGGGTIFLAGRMAREVGLGWRQEFIPQFLRFGTPLVAASLSAFAIHFSDRFFLSNWVSLADIGRYALAYRFAFLVSVLVGDSFGKSWNVTFYRFSGRENWREEFASVGHYLMLALCLVALGICLTALLLLRFMVPESYYPPTFILPALVLSYVLREVGDFFRNLLLIDKKSATVGNVGMLAAGLNFLLNFLLISRYGLYGATFATLGTWTVYMVIFWALAWREHHVPVRVSVFLRLMLLALAIFLIGRYTDAGLGLFGFVAATLWTLLYFALVSYFALTGRERREMFAFLRERGALARRWAMPRRQGAAAIADAAPSLVMLAYYFPPENAIGAARPARFAKYLARMGLLVRVISRNCDGEIDGAVTRVPADAPHGRAVRTLSWMFGRFNRVLMPHDDRYAWTPHAIAAARPLIAGNRRAVIFSSHPPIATHLAALLLKLRYGNPWIADFRDPLIGNALRTGLRGLAFDLPTEWLIFHFADVVIANTETVRDDWLRRHPAQADKIRLIWNGFDPEDGFAATPSPRHARRRIAHAGTVYGDRSPAPLLASLTRLIDAGRLRPDAFSLTLLGPVEERSFNPDHPLGDRLRRAGCLAVDSRMAAKEEAQALILDADILLLLDIVAQGRASSQLPAKIFDYLRAGRPILAITPHRSVIRDVLAGAGVPHLCIAADDPQEEIDEQVLTFLQQEHRVAKPSESFWQEFDGRRQAETLHRIVRDLLLPATP
jgi:O-antigen/teichoic acid export membrane protein